MGGGIYTDIPTRRYGPVQKNSALRPGYTDNSRAQMNIPQTTFFRLSSAKLRFEPLPLKLYSTATESDMSFFIMRRVVWPTLSPPAMASTRSYKQIACMYNNNDQSNLAKDGIAVACPPSSSFVFARWQHDRTDSLAAVCKSMIWLRARPPNLPISREQTPHI